MVVVVWVLNLARPVKFPIPFTDFDRSASGSRATESAARGARIEAFTRV